MGTMNDMQVLIEQMVSDISSQAARLDEVRLQKFLEWLKSHSSKVKAVRQSPIEFVMQENVNLMDSLMNGLKIWLDSLPLPGLLWEYHLVLNEIAWWGELGEQSLAMILKLDGQD